MSKCESCYNMECVFVDNQIPFFDSENCQNYRGLTNADRIREMNCEKLANQLVSEQYVAMKMVFTLLCQKLKDEEILDEKDAKELFCDFENEVKKRWGEMVKEKLEWLKAPVEEVNNG